ncbi:hypothetical protein QP260_23615, partial [Escherichia coli]|nr:hypothetical protein [Escherichia coli]
RQHRETQRARDLDNWRSYVNFEDSAGVNLARFHQNAPKQNAAVYKISVYRDTPASTSED